MPILIMALIALAVFLGMGLMLFYAAYSEGKTRAAEGERGGHAPVSAREA